MSRRLAVRIGLTIVCLMFAVLWPATRMVVADVGTAADTQDVLEEALRQNSRVPPRPPREFRGFDSQPVRTVINVKQRGQQRREVTIVGATRILTPAVDNGRIFAGGGFESDLFHCVDVNEGRAIWSVKFSDPGPSAAAYSDGMVVVNTESCTTYALDADTGHTIWSAWLGDPLVSAPTISGGSVFVSYPITPDVSMPFGPATPNASATETQTETRYVLACLDLRTGGARWRRYLDQDVMSAPVCVSDAVYVATFAGTVYKLSKSKGRILMARRCRATSAPVVMGDGIYLTRLVRDARNTSNRECITKLDRLTGEPVYCVAASESPYLNRVSHAVMDRSANESPQADNGADHAAERHPDETLQHVAWLLWGDVQRLQEFHGSRLLADRGALYTCMGHVLRRVDAASGETRWTLELPKPTGSDRQLAPIPPVMAGASLLVVTCDNKVLRVDPDKGAAVQTYDIGASASSEPVVSDGYVWVGTQSWKLFGIWTGSDRFTGWHQWGGNVAHTGTPSSHVEPDPPPRPRTGPVARILSDIRQQKRPVLLVVGQQRTGDAPQADDGTESLSLPDEIDHVPVETDVLKNPRVRPYLASFHVVDVTLQEVLGLTYALDQERIENMHAPRIHFAVLSSDGEILSVVTQNDSRIVARVLDRALQRTGSPVPPRADPVPASVTTTRPDNERRATVLLRLAKGLLGRNPPAAKQRLQSIVEQHPNSNAAAEARKLLDLMRQTQQD